MLTLNNIPLFEELKDSENILIAGAGGGFDIFSGIIRDYRNQLDKIRVFLFEKFLRS